jgi:NH3-dependent NAD+ synthetase
MDNEILNSYIETHFRVIDIVREKYSSWYERGFLKKGIFVPLSGGVDSSTALVFACKYADRVGWERKDVFSVFCVRDEMYEGEKEDLEMAERISLDFGVRLDKKDITSILGELNKEIEMSDADITNDERITLARALVTRAYDSYLKRLSLDTGNLSELLLAQWTTGAYAGQIDLMNGLFKTEVYELASHMGVPQYILERKKVSSELRVGALYDNYEVLDEILFYYLDGREEKSVADSTKCDLERVEEVFCRAKEHMIRGNFGFPVVSQSNMLDFQYGNHKFYTNLVDTSILFGEIHEDRLGKWSR